MSTIPQVASEVKDILTSVSARAGRLSGFVKRRSKFGGAALVQTLTFGFLAHPDATLGQLSQSAAVVGVNITGQGVAERFTAEAAECLRQVLAVAIGTVVGADPVAVPIFDRFPGGVQIQDSSVVELPRELREVWPGCGGSASDAAVKIEVRLDLRRGTLLGPLLEPGRTADSASLLQHTDVAPGALFMADLGYWDLQRLQEQTERGVWWLLRLKQGTVVFDEQEQRLDLAQFLQQQDGPRAELRVYLGVHRRVPARLLAVRVSQETADRRRRHLRERAHQQQRTVRPHQLRLADWTLVVTNVPPEQLSLQDAIVLLRARWQVELLFKLWKSQGKIDEWRTRNPWRILCEIYAKLLAMLIQHWLFLVSNWHNADRSSTKAAQTVRDHALHLASHLPRDLAGLIEVMEIIATCLASGCRINHRRKHPATFQELQRLGQHP